MGLCARWVFTLCWLACPDEIRHFLFRLLHRPSCCFPIKLHLGVSWIHWHAVGGLAPVIKKTCFLTNIAVADAEWPVVRNVRYPVGPRR